jgi:tRNA dimethylallyltransferase
MVQKPFLIVIGGPTAVGKTTLAIQLAQYFKTEIVSADARQFYKKMDIGTAKPSLEELSSAKHHFIDCLEIDQEYTAGRFENDALQTISAIHSKNQYAILVGGSGLFIKAVCSGLDDIPTIDPTIRETLNKEFQDYGLQPLVNKLKQLDIDYYNIVDRQNSQRVIRALEVCIGTNKPYSSFRHGRVKSRPFHTIKIGLELPREILYDRINARVDAMLAQGLEQEVKNLYPYRHLNSLKTVGYQELIDYFDGIITKEDAINMIKQNSRRFAKRQMTWFKKDTEFTWFSPFEFEKIVAFILSKK